MPLTVLNVAYPYAPVGDAAVGGAEQILGDLDCALLCNGYRSLVVACDGSNTAGTLFAAPMPRGLLDEADRPWWRARYQREIDSALASCQVDLIHCHGFDFHEYIFPVNVPVLVTLHMPVSWYPHGLLQGLPRNITVQYVSESQRATAPPDMQQMPVVTNGVALQQRAPRTHRGDYAVALGRICPEKNVHEALRAGTLAGVPVHVAGQVFPYATHQRYMQDAVEPELERNPAHRMLGVVPDADRSALLAGARCLLHPTLAPETSSLAAMESLAAGTPVVAYRSGALPEVVDDGVTGFLVDDVPGMAEAITRVQMLRPEDCRHAAETRFSRERMIGDYFRLYRQILRGGAVRYD